MNTFFEKKNSIYNNGFFIQNSVKFYDYNTLLTGGTSKNISIWDLRTNKIVKQWKGHVGEITEIDTNESFLHSYNNLAISSDIFGTIKTWDLRMNNELHSFKIFPRKISSIKLM